LAISKKLILQKTITSLQKTLHSLFAPKEPDEY